MARKTISLEKWCRDNNRNELLTEWCHEDNVRLPYLKQPSQIQYNSNQEANWICHEGHQWISPIVARTIFKLECPICHPENSSLKTGISYGCLTIIKVVRNSPDDSNSSTLYECKCKCGQTLFLSEEHFLEKKHRYCTSSNGLICTSLEGYPTRYECGLKKKNKENLLNSYKRSYDDSYHTDFSNTIHESLEILECVDEHYEELKTWIDKRKKGGGTYIVYKKYRCRCYLCGKEYTFKSSEFSINPPTAYGKTAYDGYYSEAYCKCHKHSSFQWIVAKVLKDNNIPYRVEHSFPDLYGLRTKTLLRFDFVIFNTNGSIKCLIECQGEQHYEPVAEFGGESAFKGQKKNDELKQIYTRDHNIPLYEIPYTSKKYENVVSFLESVMII